MDTGDLIATLAFGTMLGGLWFGVLGVRAVKKDKREGETFGDSSGAPHSAQAVARGETRPANPDQAEPISRFPEGPVETRDPESRAPGAGNAAEPVRIGERGPVA